MSAWRKAGITYNGYVNIAAQTVRKALKNELKTNTVLARSKTEAKFVSFENGAPKGEPVPIQQ
ncbi:hypothetical protein Kpol_1045p82 [Vanderwaltozyma polyspora DSM 70294]|uniref:ATP synthase subunit epsilon, mitochondrial n=1 Tax=Vanderwaltozyma polyspora (strain ATCC 22028 / DSM 70294 / BCRC 21397 / CBS 2163 / NBRC 10782 / NRRL Y-8283 / UCD 57-17) TaxID=436907 RepID=A7TI88_VANPO|nr:uncharacterized protein Kpol_1045p82 [Vanderwaltozyma polyspora DSM 70294]EDO18095.1 hypothetical protein Kpol_1045p82 [Vanderwaltozyma polyspora DSM 70294]